MLTQLTKQKLLIIVLKNVIVGCVYFVLAQIGFFFAFENSNVSPIWPPSGFAFVAILMLGHRVWPGIVIASFLADFIVFSNHNIGNFQTIVFVSTCIAIGRSLQALFGFCVLRLLNAGHILDKASNYAKFFVVAILMGMLSATIGTNSLFLSGLIPSESYKHLWFTWWLGDFSGIMILSPILITWWKKPEFKWESKWSIIAVSLFVLLAFYLELVFRDIVHIDSNHTEVYLTFLILICCVFCMNVWQSTLVVLLVAIISISNTIMGYGPFINESLNGSLISLQIFTCVATITTLFLSTTLNERKKAEQSLKEANENLEKRILERTNAIEEQKEELRKINKQMLEKTIELKRSNEELQLFAHVSSHDLQEPLRTVSSFLQLIEKKYKNILDNEAIEYINFAVNGAKRMHTLINDMLAYSRVSSSTNCFKKVDLKDVITLVLNNLDCKIKINQAKINIDSQMPTLMGDQTQLIQLFQNLIDNAIKYRCVASPEIHITTKKLENFWLFSVKDNGIGIAPKYSSQIFRLFQRLHSIQKYDGTGIGLAVCKKIVERHKGEIWVESELGKGATFYFTIKTENSSESKTENIVKNAQAVAN